ncbi:hypothetical protein ABK040_007460 [Willaertia magna]
MMKSTGDANAQYVIGGRSNTSYNLKVDNNTDILIKHLQELCKILEEYDDELKNIILNIITTFQEMFANYKPYFGRIQFNEEPIDDYYSDAKNAVDIVYKSFLKYIPEYVDSFKKILVHNSQRKSYNLSTVSLTNFLSSSENEKEFIEKREELLIFLKYKENELRELQNVLYKVKVSLNASTQNNTHGYSSTASVPKTNSGEKIDIPFIVFKQTTNSNIDSGYQFEAELWNQKIGQSMFMMQKDAFIDLLKNLITGIDEKLLEVVCDSTFDDYVSIVDFKLLLDWFGPLMSWKEELKVIQKNSTNSEVTCRLFQFWGSLTAIQAQNLLLDQEPGTYIIRFDEYNLGKYCISVVQEEIINDEATGKKQVYHFPLSRDKNKNSYYTIAENNITLKAENALKLINDKYFLTFKYPYIDHEFKANLDSSKNKAKKTSSSLLLLDDNNDAKSFVMFRGRYLELNKVDSGVKKTENTNAPTKALTSIVTTTTSTTTTTTSSTSKKEEIVQIEE